MIARIIDLEHEREVKNSYSSGYEEGRTKGILQILILCAFLALAWRFIPLWAFITVLEYFKEFLIWFGFKLIIIFKYIFQIISKIKITYGML